MVQITIHRALAKIKTTEKRFASLMSSGVFVSSMIGQSQITPGGRSVKEMTAEIKANYDSALSLLKNFEELKLAIIRSNSGISKDTTGLDETNVGGRKMLVAEIIAKQKYVMPLYKKLIDVLSMQYNKVNNEIEKRNNRVQDNLTSVLSNISNGSSEKLSENQIKSISETYYQNNSCFIVDPLNISDTIRKLQKQYDEFFDEADSRLSEVNALKIVEVSIDD